MAVVNIEAGKEFLKAGESIGKLMLIMKGTVEVSVFGETFTLKGKDIIGIANVGHRQVNMTYRTLEDCTFVPYSYKADEFGTFLSCNTDIKNFCVSSVMKQTEAVIDKYKNVKYKCNSLTEYLLSGYEEYSLIAKKLSVEPHKGLIDDIEKPEDFLPSWLSGFYTGFEQMIADAGDMVLSEDFIAGLVQKSAGDISQIIMSCEEFEEQKKLVLRKLIGDEKDNLFEYYLELYKIKAPELGMEDGMVGSVRRALEDIIYIVTTVDPDLENLCKQKESDIFAVEEVLDFEVPAPRKPENNKYENEEPKNEEFVSEELEGEIFKSEALEMNEELQKDDELQKEDELQKAEELQEDDNSLQVILDYADMEDDFKESFTKHVIEYRNSSNKNGPEDSMRRLRKSLASEFNTLYTAAFEKSIDDENIPLPLKLFFNYGFVDAELAGKENYKYLCQRANAEFSAPFLGIYTMYEWLMAIYSGSKDPGRSEFEVDYADYLHEEMRSKRISKSKEQELFSDGILRVRYELDNVFPSINKITTGRITTFCPLLTEQNIVRPIDTAHLDADSILDILDRIRSIDFGAFYRQTMYANPESGITKELIDVEVLPDIILAPNVGSIGIMWQEIAGKKRTTPARMFLSALLTEDLELQMLRLTGQFRWEMCKREQGARWNDITEHSLTSEYCDYVQYYRKNSDLSPDAKEKIKNDLVRCRNSFREMFIRDYVSWIRFEANGSPRLNKVTRNILFSYIPFSKEKRSVLEANPMYKDFISRYNIKQAAKIHRMENLMKKLTNMGVDIPDEIGAQMEYLEG